MEAHPLVAELNVVRLADAGARQIRFEEQVRETPELQRTKVAVQGLGSGTDIGRLRSDPEEISQREAVAANAMPHPILANWSRLFLADLSGALYARIMQIGRYKDGWRGEGSKALTEDALGAFLDFLIRIDEGSAEPTLALTGRGTLQAEWFHNSRRHFDVEFVSSEKAFFGLFDRQSVYEGVDSVKGLARWLTNRPSNPVKWQCQQG